MAGNLDRRWQQDNKTAPVTKALRQYELLLNITGIVARGRIILIVNLVIMCKYCYRTSDDRFASKGISSVGSRCADSFIYIAAGHMMAPSQAMEKK